MSAALPIVDLSTHGDTKNRDVYGRNSFSSIKGDGVSASELLHGFYGVLSSDDSTYEMARISVTESATDTGIGSIAFSTNMDGGASVSEVLSLSVASSSVTTDLFAVSGTLQTQVIQLNTDTGATPDGVQIDLVDSDTAGSAQMNFSVGNLNGVFDTDYFTPLSVQYDPLAAPGEEGIVAVDGTLTVNGTDIFAAVTDGNPWEIDSSVATTVNLKDTYDMLDIGKVTPTIINVNIADTFVHNTTTALDVNGAVVIRGNNLSMFDEALESNYSVLNYTESSTTSNVALRASRAGDFLVMQSENDAGGLLDRVVVSGGTATAATAYVGNVGVFGVGYTNSSPPTVVAGVSLDVAGGAIVNGGLEVTSDIDVTTNNIVNVTNIDSDNSVAEQARITLTSDATEPQLDITLGDLTATPTPIVTVTELLTTITNDVSIGTGGVTPTTTTIQGNLVVEGETTSVNTSTIEVEDQNITLASEISVITNLVDSGLHLGDNTGPLVSFHYTQASLGWESTHGITLASGASNTLEVDTTTLGTDLTLAADDSYIFLGATSQWRIGVEDDAGTAHFVIAHNDGGLGTYVTKLDVEE